MFITKRLQLVLSVTSAILLSVTSSILLSSCMSTPKKVKNYWHEPALRDFYLESDIKITDKIDTKPGLPKVSEALLRQVQDASDQNLRPSYGIDIEMGSCYRTQAFWESYWSILSVVTLTIFPLENDYTCRIDIRVTNLLSTSVTEFTDYADFKTWWGIAGAEANRFGGEDWAKAQLVNQIMYRHLSEIPRTQADLNKSKELK